MLFFMVFKTRVLLYETEIDFVPNLETYTEQAIACQRLKSNTGLNSPPPLT
jgi:hypothetical protein